jgi:hypothetical protein
MSTSLAVVGFVMAMVLPRVRPRTATAATVGPVDGTI